MATLTRELIQECCAALYGDHVARHHDGTEVDLSGEWPQIPLYTAVSDAVGEKVTPDDPGRDAAGDRRTARGRRGPGLDPGQAGRGAVRGAGAAHAAVADLRHRLPAGHLAAHPGAPAASPGLAEKWDLYIGGIERATAYSELVDPVAQRERFSAQAVLAAAGDPEAMALDEDFLEALEYGMPPTGGMGMGMDRLMMTLTGLGIRETILFPLVRPIHLLGTGPGSFHHKEAPSHGY